MVGFDGIFLPTGQFLVAGTLIKGSVKMGVICGFQEVLEIVNNDVEELEEGATEVHMEIKRESRRIISKVSS